VSHPRKIHVATQAYLERFTHGGRLIAHRLRTGESSVARPAAVAYRKNWWGNNAEVAKAAEWALSQYESPASEVLRSLPSAWPLSGEDRASLAAFIAIHTIRTPAFRAQAEAVAEATILEQRLRWPQMEGRFDRAAEKWRRDPWRWPHMMGRQIPRVASLLACMMWVLVAFDDPLLITSDQPVVAVPVLGPGERREISVFPSGGYLDTIEFRFAIDPHNLLLLIWADGRDPVRRMVGDLDMGCDANRAVRSQADEEWFSTPQRTPQFLRPPFADTSECSPIAPRLVAGYDGDAVKACVRRDEAERIQRELMSGRQPGMPDIIRWVYAA
jgi:Protein of unknown function (DUF4238)